LNDIYFRRHRSVRLSSRSIPEVRTAARPKRRFTPLVPSGRGRGKRVYSPKGVLPPGVLPKGVIHPKGVQLKGKAVLGVPMSISHEFK
jgi:hypothetical protein